MSEIFKETALIYKGHIEVFVQNVSLPCIAKLWYDAGDSEWKCHQTDVLPPPTASNKPARVQRLTHTATKIMAFQNATTKTVL